VNLTKIFAIVGLSDEVLSLPESTRKDTFNGVFTTGTKLMCSKQYNDSTKFKRLYDLVETNAVPLKREAIIARREDLYDASLQTLNRIFDEKDKQGRRDDDPIFSHKGDANIHGVTFPWSMIIYGYRAKNKQVKNQGTMYAAVSKKITM